MLSRKAVNDLHFTVSSLAFPLITQSIRSSPKDDRVENKAALPAPQLTRLILRLAAPALQVLVPVGAPDSVPVAPLPGQLSAVARECSGGWPRCLGPAPHGRPGKAPGSWLLPSDQRGAPAAARRP